MFALFLCWKCWSFLSPWWLFVIVFPKVHARTDAPDVSALNVMYNSLNSATQLSGWKSSGGDPCSQNWRGIKCSGSKVTQIRLPALGLSGSMGYQLSSLTSVTYLQVRFSDLSNNNLQGDIPYQLPPNVLHINLADNGFTGSIPYSISQMTDLQYLNLANNQLNGQLTDMFGKLPSLSTLDLSSNHLTGNLPQSFESLTSLKTLRLQDNQFTGTIKVLATLPLEELNIGNNHFSGWIPSQLADVKNLKTGGNSWSSGPAPPDSTSQGNIPNSSSTKSKGGKGGKGGLSVGAIVGLIILLLIVIGILLALLTRVRSSLSRSHYIDEESVGHNRSFSPLFSRELAGLKTMESSSSIQMKSLEVSPPLGIKPLASDRQLSIDDQEFMRKLNSKRHSDSVNVTVYSSHELLVATGNFTSSRLLGEGSIGQVYKAKCPDGKVLAVKKIDLSQCPLNNSEFMDVVSGLSHLHHPNILELTGYCMETNYKLLVFEFMRNGSLHDFLHLSDEYSRPLTWDTRIRIALGTARAIEYLHEVCSPSAIHKNIKSANILLDAELNSHLADCGLMALYQDPKKNLESGYSAPESSSSTSSSSAYTSKSDIYCFGIVMLELLTGRMPFDRSKPRSEQSLVRWAVPQLHDIDALEKMVDPALRGLYPPKALSRFADVIALCVQSEPEFRPPVSEVVQTLVRCVQRPSMRIDDDF